MSERMRKFFKNIFGRNNQDNIHINDVTPDQPKEKTGKFKKLRKRISRLFGCRRPCCSDIAEEPELPYEEAKEEMKPYSPISFKKCCEKIKMRVDWDSYFASSAEYSTEYLETFEREEEQRELFKPLTPAPFRRYCWMENENPAWKPLDCRSNTASISVSSLEGDTESQSIEIIKPTASAVRRHCWMEDEDSTWDSQDSVPDSSWVEEVPVPFILDDSDRESIDQEEVLRPIPPDSSLVQMEDEDLEWKPVRCSSNIAPIGSLDSEEIEIIAQDSSLMQIEDEDLEWKPLRYSSNIAPIGSLDSEEIGIIAQDSSLMQIEDEDLEWKPLRCSSNIAPIGSLDSDEIGIIALASFTESSRKESDSDASRYEMLLSQRAERADLYSENQDISEEEKNGSERLAQTPEGPQNSLVGCASSYYQRNTRFDSMIWRIDTALNHTRLVCGTPPTINDFNIQSLIGEGSFGKVYKAKYRGTGRIVAIKTTSNSNLDEPNAFSSVLHEQRILLLAKKENCHFLTRLFASFRTEHYTCLAMDFAEGGDLVSQLGRSGISQERTIFYSACIVLGLQFLHERNIAHRDLKLENVLLDRDGYAKLTDFGISKEGMGFTGISQTQCGTLDYMAPEMFTRISHTKSVDWWALGVSIYRMLVGKMPFTGEDDNEVILSIICFEPTYPPDLTVESYNIITQLLMKFTLTRLGHSKNGAEEVKKSEFFQGLDWEALEKKQVQPPFVPEIESPDTSNEGLVLEPPLWTVELLNDTKMALKELDYPVSSETET